MPPILRWIFENPILLIILVGWILSAVASARQAAQKRAAQAPSRPPAQDRELLRPTPPRRAAVPPASAPQSTEQIAEAIRRAMGLETIRAPQAPSPPPPQQQRPQRQPRVDYDELVRQEERSYEEVTERRPRSYDEIAGSRPVVSYDEARPVRRLVDELKKKADADREEKSKRATPGAEMSSRKLGSHIGGPALRAHRRRPAHRILDLSRPASAFVAAEIFGQPVGFREPFGELFSS